MRYATIVSILIAGCGAQTGTVADAGLEGPRFEGTVLVGSLPKANGIIELQWAGGAPFEVSTDEMGRFADELPESGVDYQYNILPGESHWGRSGWLLDVSELGYENLQFGLADDTAIEGFSNVLGEPRLSEDSGLVSIDIQINEAQVAEKSFSIQAEANPIFVFTDEGIPLRSDVLVLGGDGALIFGNVAPQDLAPATPNSNTPCAQQEPASEVRAKTILTLVARCQ